MNKIIKNISSILLPKKCFACEGKASQVLCLKCTKKISPDYFKLKIKPSPSVGLHIFAFEYNKEIRDLIKKAKYEGYPKIIKHLTKICISQPSFADLINAKKYDFIVPVPMHSSKLRARGFNQSEISAKLIARKADFSLLKALKKLSDTQALAGKKKSQRKKIAEQSFDCEKKFQGYFKNKNLLLVDDVYTSGATTEECAKVLLKYGAKSVSVFTLAKRNSK